MSASLPLPAPPRVVALADVPWQPWRNGRGRTRELLAWPDGDDWRVRVSVAEIAEPAPFSAFPSVERWFAVMEGGGVELHVGGAVRRMLATDAPLRFDGAAVVEASPIDGATRDLNLMVRDGRGAMVVAGDDGWWSPAGCGDGEAPAHAKGVAQPAARAQAGLYAARPVRWAAQLDARRTVVSVEGELPADALLWFVRAPRRLRASPRPGHEAGATAGWWLAAFPRDTAAEHDRA